MPERTEGKGRTGKGEYPEPLAPTVKLDPSQIQGCVSRLYAPQSLLNRTLEEKRRRKERADAEYTIEKDPHLQIYWHRQGHKQMRKKRLPPLKHAAASPSDGTPSESAELVAMGAASRGELRSRTSASPSHIGSPRMVNEVEKRHVLKKRDLTALAILVRPPVHFQSQVHRLDVAGHHQGCYDLKWMLSVTRADAEKLGPNATTTPNGRTLLTLDDLAASDMAQEDLRPDLPRGAVLLSSPRSAVCCLRFGIPPSDLLTHRLEWFQKQAGLEGAPAHIAQRRRQFFENERKRLLDALCADYHAMKQHTSLKKMLHLFMKFNPDSNYDHASDQIELDKLSMCNDTDSPYTPAAADGTALHDGSPSSDDADDGGGDDDEENNEGAPPTHDSDEYAADAAPDADGATEADPDATGTSPATAGGRADGVSPGARSGVVVDDTIKNREEVLKEKCHQQLVKAKKKLQGHLVRTILLARVKQKNSNDRRQKMDERIQRFQEERQEKIVENRRRAAEKSVSCRQVLEESRALQKQKMLDLIRKQEEGEARRLETAKHLQLVREVKREDASLKVKKKIEGVVRQRNAHEWTKLCILDRVRRKHDRADFAAACLHETLDENKYKREVMLRENDTVMRMLHQHML